MIKRIALLFSLGLFLISPAVQADLLEFKAFSTGTELSPPYMPVIEFMNNNDNLYATVGPGPVLTDHTEYKKFSFLTLRIRAMVIVMIFFLRLLPALVMIIKQYWRTILCRNP